MQKQFTNLIVATTLAVGALPLSAAEDDDHPLLGRYPDAQNTNYARTIPFDSVELPAGPMTSDGPDEVLELEGRIRIDGFVSPADTSEIMAGRSYEAALEENGFNMLYSCVGNECGGLVNFLKNQSFRDMGQANPSVSGGWGWKHFVTNNDRVRYYLARKESDEGIAHALVYISRYRSSDSWVMIGQIIVESTPLEIREIESGLLDVEEEQRRAVEEHEMEALSREQIQDSLVQEGRVAVQDILFEFDSSDIRPESADALATIAELMQDSTGLNLLVVGHTDTIGDFDYNLNLSMQRAQAVVGWLKEQHGISANRLRAAGAGMMSPIATNRNEKGRAENRRVELVELVESN